MATRRLKNYLRMHRKRTGLTQNEVSYLLGYSCESKVSRCERFNRVPNLEMALALEIIFRAPVRDLFAGMFDMTEQKILRRIGTLGTRLQNRPYDRRTQQKLRALAAVLREARLRSAEDE